MTVSISALNFVVFECLLRTLFYEHCLRNTVNKSSALVGWLSEYTEQLYLSVLSYPLNYLTWKRILIFSDYTNLSTLLVHYHISLILQCISATHLTHLKLLWYTNHAKGHFWTHSGFISLLTNVHYCIYQRHDKAVFINYLLQQHFCKLSNLSSD